MLELLNRIMSTADDATTCMQPLVHELNASRCLSTCCWS